MDEREKLTRAKRIFAAMMGFYIHLAIFVVVMTALLVINRATSSTWWVQWPLLVWGIAIAMHGWTVFGHVPQARASFRRWEAKKIRELMNKME